jgi:hypothetical protein
MSSFEQFNIQLYSYTKNLFPNNAREGAIHFTNLFKAFNYVMLTRDLHPNAFHPNLPRFNTVYPQLPM